MDESGDAGRGGRGGGRSRQNGGRSSVRLGVRMEFRFSGFHAVQVPVVSDRLLITITSVDSGKTIAKSSKAAAINGACQWHDSILHAIRFPKDEVSQEFQECQCKIVVSMGSTRTAVLGEAYLNLTNYLSSSDSTDISLPLKNCNSGTVLQLKIQCLGAKSKSSGKSWKGLSSNLKESPTNDEMDKKADVFDILLKLNKGAQSLSENNLEADNADESGNRDASFSESKSHGDDSSKNHLDTAEEKLEELRNAAKVWERHSRKLKIEQKTLKNECADKSKQQAELERQLSASLSEQDSLRQEIEQVTAQLNKTQETNIELVSILQELEETIELQRVEMSKLPQVSDVADHEVSKSESTVQEAAEWARILSQKEDEITVLREKLNRVLKMENADGAGPDVIYLELEKENDFLKVKIQELENDFSELTEENFGLIYKLKEASGVAKEEDPCISNSEEMPTVGSPTYKIKHLERKCADLELNLENFRSEFSGLEEKFQKSQEELKERTLELSELREKLSHATELEGADTGSSRHYRLRSGEPDDTETDLDVLKRTVQLKEQEIDGLQHCTREMENTIADIQKEKSQLEERLAASLQESSMTSKCLVEAHEDLVLTSSVDSHVSSNEVLETKISELERTVQLKEQEIDGLQHCAREMENTIADIQKEKSQLEERLAASLQESSMTSKCLVEAHEDLVLTSSVDSHVSANEVLETKISELVRTVTLKEQEIDGLQHCVREMENTIADIQKEKSQLEERLDSHVSANEVLETKISELVRTVMLKEQEIDSLQHCRGEMENTIADIQKKSQLEERLAASLEETSMTSKCLDEAREELLVLTSSVDSHVSANEVLETKISELVHTVMLKEQEIDGLQLCTREMENTIADIQKEKTQLEERLAASLEESSMTSKWLDEAREDLLVLSSSVDSHVSANGVLETKINELVHTVMLKEQEINGLQHCTTEMENTISDIQKEKDQLEERLAASLEESSMTSKCLDEAREDLLVLTSSVDSHASANKVLERKISELESRKVELELLVTKLEQENIEFSEFISELESQLTSLTSEEEATRLEMDYSISLIANLKDLVEQQQAEMEAQKLEMKQKHLESQTRLSEVQEDSEALRRSNAKLQATIDSVAEECSSLQTLTADLKKQKLELHDHCAQLEQQLDQSKRKTMDLFETAEFLEAKLSTLQKEVTLKEQSLLSELENIFQEHKEHEERINSAHFLLHKIENEKIGEVKNLEREVMSLTAQLSSTDGEKDSAALDSIHEVSILRADKAKLEANLEDVSAQMRHYQSQLEDLRTESKTKIKGLIDSLNASKHNEETLTTDVEHMTRLMEAARSNEENLRKTSDELELKYKSSDYEKQEVMEEISGLKIQVSKMASIQDEVFKLQSSLDQAKFEKTKLEERLQSLSEECEELKVQKAMLTDQVSCIQSTLHDADEENRRKSTQAKLVVNKGNDDAANDNGGTHVNEDLDIHSKLELLETRLADALEENKSYRAQLQSPTGEGQLGRRDEKDNKDGNRIAQLESELKDMQDRLLNVSMQYAEVEAQREELVMELKSATARKGRWF
ncbi:myosin-9-like [Triticum urartu]|nr:myosin-9-like [Triticum urartu]